MKKIVCCPVCHKIIAKIDEQGEMKKAYLWCRRCKKEIYIGNVREIETKPES